MECPWKSAGTNRDRRQTQHACRHRTFLLVDPANHRLHRSRALPPPEPMGRRICVAKGLPPCTRVLVIREISDLLSVGCCEECCVCWGIGISQACRYLLRILNKSVGPSSSGASPSRHANRCPTMAAIATTTTVRSIQAFNLLIAGSSSGKRKRTTNTGQTPGLDDLLARCLGSIHRVTLRHRPRPTAVTNRTQVG